MKIQRCVSQRKDQLLSAHGCLHMCVSYGVANISDDWDIDTFATNCHEECDKRLTFIMFLKNIFMFRSIPDVRYTSGVR